MLTLVQGCFHKCDRQLYWFAETKKSVASIKIEFNSRRKFLDTNKAAVKLRGRDLGGYEVCPIGKFP